MNDVSGRPAHTRRRKEQMEYIKCDVLVAGGGAAGSRAALAAKTAGPRLRVMVVVDGVYESGGSTNMAASEALGINAPFNYADDGDSPEIFEKDILETGGGLADPALCRIVARESGDRVRELMDLGMVFFSRDGHPQAQKLSGCTKARSLTNGGSTGREMVRVLKKQALQKGVEIIEHLKIFSLFQDENGTVRGVYGMKDGKPVFIESGAVVLATGGAPSMFSVNVSAATQTGDGWAMAYNAGCRFTNMEFFQCGPAVMNCGMKFIIHSHMWRFLPKLTNKEGKEFLSAYCTNGVSAQEALDLKAMSYPFSVRTGAMYVDIAVYKEIMAGRCLPHGGISFDVTHIAKEDLLKKAPITYETLLKAGIDLAVEPLELGIAVQNFNGGVIIDENGFTGVEGLYAAGEVTGGVHGSDRPGGNNLSDTQVFGYRAGRAASAFAETNRRRVQGPEIETGNLAAGRDEADIIRESEALYYKEMTVIRHKAGIEKILDFIDQKGGKAVSVQLKNRLCVGRLLANAIRARDESRGTHYREDRPKTEESWRRRIVLVRGSDGLPREIKEKK
ncbi:MAG: FAD-binding protein [Treponema sp.]|jgi:fumarate reductase (CoM/CoB) subunit A|nr:FAD-binding protein [Treponema sp.]